MHANVMVNKKWKYGNWQLVSTTTMTTPLSPLNAFGLHRHYSKM